MIVERLASKRPKLPTPVMGFYSNKNITQTEYLFRNKIIKQQVDDAGYSSGEIVRPSNEKDFKLEGYYRVLSIATTWYEYRGSETDDSKVEWPDTNNPKIVQAMCLKTKKVYDCTANYFVGVTAEEAKDAQTSIC